MYNIDVLRNYFITKTKMEDAKILLKTTGIALAMFAVSTPLLFIILKTLNYPI